MITEQEKLVFKKLSLTLEWQLVEKLAKEMIEEIQQRPKMHDNEWDTLKSVIGDESEIKGARRLVQEVYKLAKEAK